MQRRPLTVEILEDRSLPSNSSFIGQLYDDTLGRAGSPAEVSAWAGLLAAGQSRSAVAYGIALSTEGLTYEVNALYHEYLGRVADPAGLQGWRGQLAAGVPVADVVASFLASPEYYQAEGNGNDADWVKGLYADLLHRAPDAAGLAGWVSAIQAGASRYSVALGILNSPEGLRVQVNDLYFQLLNRPGVTDPGSKGWSDLLAQGASREFVTASIQSSSEYDGSASRNSTDLPNSGAPSSVTVSVSAPSLLAVNDKVPLGSTTPNNSPFVSPHLVPGDPAVEQATVTFTAAAGVQGHWYVRYPSGNLRVFQNASGLPLLPSDNPRPISISAGGTATVSLLLQGYRPSATTGDLPLEVTFVGPDGTTSRGSAALTEAKTNLLADTNRDALADAADQAAKGDWTRQGGALVLPDLSKSDPNSVVPNDWVGYWLKETPGANPGDPYGAPVKVFDFNGDGIADPPQRTIPAGDKNLAPLVIDKLALGTLGDDWKLVLKATPVAGESAYFSQDGINQFANNRVRVFLPSDGRSFKTGDDSIIGPEAGDTAVFAVNPGAGEHDLGLFRGRGSVQFGVQGIVAGSEVDLNWTWMKGTQTVFADRTRIRVSPYIVANDNLPALTGTPSVFVSAGKDGTGIVSGVPEDEPPSPPQTGLDNVPLLQALSGIFGSQLYQMRTNDAWQQDGWQAGYAQAPYGSLPIVLELPRARERDGGDFRNQIRTQLLSAGVGVSTDVVVPAGQKILTDDSGGNLEALPAPGSAGSIYRGSGASAYLADFLDAQGVQPTVAVNTNWLAVKHVDEVSATAPNGKMVIADPDSAWALLLWANQVDPNATMLPGINGNGPGGIAVNAVVTGTMGQQLSQFNFNTVEAPQNLPSIRSALEQTLGTSGPESVPVKEVGSSNGALLKGGALVGFFGNDSVWNYRVVFANSADNTEYQFWFQPGSGQPWALAGTGHTTKDEVFPAARAFLLAHYWQGTPAAGDVYSFAADPNATTVEMPVLFVDSPHGAEAYTLDHVNALVTGTTVVTAQAFGPAVNYLGTGPGDILQDYVQALFGDAGYTNVQFADARYYHANLGSIHCGTNVIRVPPTIPWWQP